MHYPELLLFLLNLTLQSIRLNLLPLDHLHLVPLPPEHLGLIQLPHLKHEFLLRPHVQELSRQRVLDRMPAVHLLNHIFQLFNVLFLKPLNTLRGGSLVILHVVVPGA